MGPFAESDSQGPFWSNCLIQALLAKVGNWKGVQILAYRKAWHVHFMWRELDSGRVLHFTHARLEGGFTSWLFRGTVESVPDRFLDRNEDGFSRC